MVAHKEIGIRSHQTRILGEVLNCDQRVSTQSLSPGEKSGATGKR